MRTTLTDPARRRLAAGLILAATPLLLALDCDAHGGAAPEPTCDEDPGTGGGPAAPLQVVFDGDDHGFDACHAIGAGPEGGFVVAGEVTRLAEGGNAWARAYAADGAARWTYELHTPSEGRDRARALVALADGGAVVAGQWYSGSSTRQNHFLTRLTGTGAATWLREGELLGDDLFFGLARDSTGALITAGFQPDPAGSGQAWVQKLGVDGVGAAWTIVRDGARPGLDAANAVACGADDSVVAAGVTVGAAGADGWVAKYDADGALAWGHTLASDGAFGGEANGVAVGPDGGVIVVGATGAAGAPGTASWIRAYTAGGEARWKIVTTDVDVWRAVAVAGDGTVVVTGSQGPDLAVRAYDAGGVPQWQRSFPGARGNAVAVDGHGAVLVCGEITTGGNTDALVLKYGS